MTLRQVYQKGKVLLEKAGIETPAFDAVCLFQKVFGLDRQQLIIHGTETAADSKADAYWMLCEKRAKGRPLQYILGEWPFMDFTLRVGDGVLVPRDETELLVYTVAEHIKSAGLARADLQGADLCGGSGAVALGLSSLLPRLKLFCAEFYEEAFHYLEENVRLLENKAVCPVRLDVLSPEAALPVSRLDLVVSNPPYVAASEIAGLQREVQQEPYTALDGGEDGLLFYRAIARRWIPQVRPGGIVAVEIGEGQAQAVMKLFHDAGVRALEVYKDFNGLDRVVIGTVENGVSSSG